MLIDSHCHVDFNAFKEDAEEVIGRSLRNGVWMINVGAQYSTSARAVKMADKYNEGLYAVVGLHPIHLVEDITETTELDGKEYSFLTRREEFDPAKYRELALSSKKVVGLGESGLDYYYFGNSTKLPLPVDKIKEIQKKVFQGFIDLSHELQLPLVMHCRGANDDHGVYDELLEIIELNISAGKSFKGVMHCFKGNRAQAQRFVELGFYVGFTGIITFKKKSEELQEIAKALPLDKILVETDAPFMSPEPHRGKRNEPAYVEFVARKIAELRGIDFEEVARVTTENAKTLFKI